MGRIDEIIAKQKELAEELELANSLNECFLSGIWGCELLRF
jgi:hypothetical protein